MSTSKRKKEERQRMLKKQAQERKRDNYLNQIKSKMNKESEFNEYTPEKVYRRETQNIPSYFSKGRAGETAKAKRYEYTGTLIKGISTMHKSNAVPIINEEEAKEHASMRR